MDISKEKLDEFKQIHKEEWGEELTDSEATEMIHSLMALYEVLCQPLPHSSDSREAS